MWNEGNLFGFWQKLIQFANQGRAVPARPYVKTSRKFYRQHSPRRMLKFCQGMVHTQTTWSVKGEGEAPCKTTSNHDGKGGGPKKKYVVCFWLFFLLFPSETVARPGR